MAKQLRQARAVARAAHDWMRYDLPEIVFPGSLPNPPGYVPESAKGGPSFPQKFIRACRRYVETWDAKKVQQERAERAAAARGEPIGGTAGSGPAGAGQQPPDDGPTLSEEFVAAAKGGTQALKPFLANLYATRARAYKDAVQQFVQGYQDGFRQAMAPEVPADVAQEMAAQADAQAAEAAPPAGGGRGQPAVGEDAQQAASGLNAASNSGTGATAAEDSSHTGEFESICQDEGPGAPGRGDVASRSDGSMQQECGGGDLTSQRGEAAAAALPEETAAASPASPEGQQPQQGQQPPEESGQQRWQSNT